jgi:hypothetical protein
MQQITRGYAQKSGALARQEQQIGQLDWLHPQHLGFFRDGVGLSQTFLFTEIHKFKMVMDGYSMLQ